ncbi:MAG: flagellar biosynthesis anti-sigma factor FlgM [Spirochaetales bacterium]|nr:flagellar biosynthesis anti-sigma factor FlgM [Spirochaetales bacterium]
MTIDRLGSIDPLSQINKAGKTGKAVKPQGRDTISVSDEAKNLGEVYRAAEMVKASPDIRMDRVEEVKMKLQDPNYIDSKIGDVADRLMEAFGLN